MSAEGVSQTFLVIADLANAMGVSPINKLPGLWEVELDERWRIWVNAKTEKLKTARGVEVMPFHCYVEFNGWPAGTFSPYGGVIAAGSVANEEALLVALRAKIASASKGQVA